MSASAATELVKAVTHCRACGSGQLDEVLDLGTHAVSDFYEKVPSDELRAPLCLVQCEGCGLVQLTHSVSRDRLYKDYWYRSGLNPSMVAALKDVVDDATARVTLWDDDVVLDIGSNDGTLLNYYPSNVITVGFEPSNLSNESFGRHSIHFTYYPVSERWFIGQAKIITSIAMFYDLDDPNAFVKAIKEDLHPEGIWVNQMMTMEDMLLGNAFDNICHEHVAYWSFTDFYQLVRSHGLAIDAVSHNAVNGGSTRYTMKHGDNEQNYPHVWNHHIRKFASKVAGAKGECLDFLHTAKAKGKTVLGYGASTKGNTLLQYYGITTDLLPAIAERNPDKVGKMTAGSHIPIISEDEMRQRKPDYLLVFPWAFLDHFLEREKDLIAQGTRLVVPLPTFRVIGE